MSKATALAKAQVLKTTLLKAGVPEVSIELIEGRPVSGDRWDSLFIVTNFDHHIVSSYKPTALTPVLALVKAGRSDLPGPLCNGYGGWDLCARIICMGYANHPGAGGPISVPKTGGGKFVIPKDSARRYAFGWEFEGGINAADWDKVLTNPRNGKKMTFREFMGRCGAGTQNYFKLPREAHLEHKTWAPGRKTDRIGYSQATGILEIKKYAAPISTPKPPVPPVGVDEMTPAQMAELKEFIEKRVQAYANFGALHTDQMLGRTMEALAKALKAEDIADDAAIAALTKLVTELKSNTAPTITVPK